MIPLVGSRNFLEFILSNYDTATQIENLYNDKQLNNSDSDHWLRIGKSFRRATKYIAEQVVLLQPDENTKAEDKFLVSIAEKIQICAEEMISLYIVSDQTYSIFPDETYLEIFPIGNKNYFFQGLTRELPNDNSRLRLDVTNRNRFIPSPDFLLNAKKQNEIIGQAVKNTIGITYEKALGVIYQVIEGALPPTEGFSVPFVHKEKFITILSKELKLPKESIQKAIAGFSLSKKQMETEGRQAWNSKQEYRAYRRAFFEMPHPSGTHITFSKYMAKECLTLFLKDVAFKRFPKEWLSPSVDKALSTLSNKAGKWFEDIVEENIKTLGYKGIKSASVQSN